MDDLAAAVTGAVVEAATAARWPGPLYGLVLQHGMGGLAAYAIPLYQVSREAMLAAGEEAHGLWDPTWADGYPLPDGVPEEMPDRMIEVSLDDHEDVYAAFERYRGDDPESDRAYDAIETIWRDAAAALTRLNWHDRLQVTDDFVALAYPHDPRAEDIRNALRSSLGKARYREFEDRGWVPESD